MWAPYASNVADAVTIAHTSLAAAFTAVVWREPLRPKLASGAFLLAVWLAASTPFEPALLQGFSIPIEPTHVAFVLKLSGWLAAVAFLLARPRWVALVAGAAAWGMMQVTDFIKESDYELAGAYLASFGVLYAIYLRASRPALTVSPPPRAISSHTRHDLVVFVLATSLGAFVSIFILERFAGSGDEWGYTYNADLFAHLKAYSPMPACPTLFSNYWVFQYQDRVFAQYTPGWSLLMAPFQRLGVVWLAAPMSLGAMAVATARLGRRVMGGDPAADSKLVSLAGTIAGVTSMLGVSVLLNAGSRYPHVMEAACFAWAVEATCAMATRGVSKRAQWLWGVVLGSSAVLMIAVRTSDGAALGIGVFLVFAQYLLRGRIGWRAVVGAALGFIPWALVSLVILRLQLGEWLKTGYDIADQYFAWAKVTFSVPKPNEFKIGLPLATGAFSWWPCAPALGAAGLLLARGSGRGAAFMLGFAAVPLSLLYVMLEFGRSGGAGYGPRYQLPLVVSMAVGGGVLFAPLARDALRRAPWGVSAFRAAGPAVLAAVAMISGVLRIGPYMYVPAHKEAHDHDATFRAIAKQRLKNAVVSVNWGDLSLDPMDLAQNLPSEKNPDVVIVVGRGGMATQCGKELFPDRYWYRAVGLEEVELQPE